MANLYLGIDVGGSNTKAVLLRGLKKQKFRCFSVRTPKRKKDFLEMMVGFVREVSGGMALSGIGVGLPGIVDPGSGVLRYAPNLRFMNGWNAKKFFRKFAARVAADNDVRAMLAAEARFGAARDRQSAVIMAVGTGVGGAILIDGKIYRGADFGAGELGHMVVGAKNGSSTLERLVGGKFAFARKGREEILAAGVANIVNVLNPEVVIMGGGAIANGNLDFEKIKKAAKKFMFPPLRRTRVVQTGLGGTAQAIGAAILAART